MAFAQVNLTGVSSYQITSKIKRNNYVQRRPSPDRTLVDAGITTCFTNPGTSEMHFVAALDTVPEMRAVLALFEGVATGAADGYARMADKPAATLLHLGCGLGNGLANLHNARKGRVPVLNIVGDHATTTCSTTRNCSPT
jgi:thiamine pyrophosphate-dependent acetolactate synthase large subunit-like protein